MDTNCHTTCEAPGEVTEGVRLTVSPFGFSDNCPRTLYHNTNYPAIALQLSSGLNQLRNGSSGSQISMTLASNTKVMRPLFIKDSTGVVAGFKPQFVNGRLIAQGGSFVIRDSGPLPLIKASDIDYATSSEFILGGSSVKSACGDNSNCPCGGPITLGKIASGETEPPPEILAVDDEIFIDLDIDPGWDIGAHEYGVSLADTPAEFDVVGATYYAVAPVGYGYNGTQDTNYSTRKYNTLADAAAALPATPTTPIVINIVGTWLTADGAVNFTGVTTSASNYVLVRAIGGARHSGVWAEDKYRVVGGNTDLFKSSLNHFRIDGLQAHKNATNTHGLATVLLNGTSASARKDVSNCIIRVSGDPTWQEFGIENSGSAGSRTNIWNTIVYGFPSAAVLGNYAIYCGRDTYCYNCTVIGGYICYYRPGGALITLKNCYGANSTNDIWSVSITRVTCASNKTDIFVTTLDLIPFDITTFVNVTPGSEDFRLVSGSQLIGTGTNTSTDPTPMNFTTDITGKTR